MKATSLLILTGYVSFESVAWALLYTEHRLINQWPKARKEQPCQLLQLPQLSMEILSKFPRSGNRTDQPERVSVQRGTMPQSCMPMEARPPKTSCRGSYMESKSNSGRLTKSTAAVWSARFISEILTLRTTFPSGSNPVEFQEERL
jgi:hypothetical protein